MQESGYIYCLSNESYSDKYKIGCTKHDPFIRIKQLNTTGVPTPFKLEFAKRVMNYSDKEKEIHNKLDIHRVNKNREFFKINLSSIRELFELVDGEWYKPFNVIKTSKNNNIDKISKLTLLLNKTENDTVSKITKMLCNRCYSKIDIQQKIIKCSHNNICFECSLVVKVCHECQIEYTKN